MEKQGYMEENVFFKLVVEKDRDSFAGGKTQVTQSDSQGTKTESGGRRLGW